MPRTEVSGTPVTRAMHWLFADWRFPTLVLWTMFFYEVLLFALLLAPDTGGPMGDFTRDFKVWCFGYDPATRRVQPMYVVMMLTEPATLSATLLVFWWKPLKEMIMTAPRNLIPWGGAALALVLTAAVVLGVISTPTDQTQELPFPAERLRTSYTPPAFSLTDHTGKTVSLDELQGRVVVLTAVYASCGFTCPMIMSQAKRAVENLTPEQRASVTIVGITLDPENDTPERLAHMAQGQEVNAPLFRLATGDATVVNALLDDLQIARKRDPETGIIDHVNVFSVIDRAGRLSYRFSLGERQEQWLESALRLLTNESRIAG